MSAWLGQVTLRTRKEPMLMGSSRRNLGGWIKDTPPANCCIKTLADGQQQLVCTDPMWISPPGNYPGYSPCAGGGAAPSPGPGPGGGGVQTCPEGQVMDAGVCHPPCGAGEVWDGTQCRSSVETTPAGGGQSGGGGNVPPGGTVPSGGATPPAGGSPAGGPPAATGAAPGQTTGPQTLPTQPLQQAQASLPQPMTQTYPTVPTGASNGAPFMPPPSNLTPAPMRVQNVAPAAPPVPPPAPPPVPPPVSQVHCPYQLMNVSPWTWCLMEQF